MTGLRVFAAGHAFVQNLRRGHYEIAVDQPARCQLAAAFSPTGKSNLTVSVFDGPFDVPDDRPTQQTLSMFLVPSLTALIGHRAWWPGHSDEPEQAPSEQREPAGSPANGPSPAERQS